MTTKTPNNLTSMVEATTVRWLAKTLAHARIDTKNVPTPDAVGRIRARVLGVEATQKTERSIAA